MHSFFHWLGIINLLGSVQAFVFFLIFLNQKKGNDGAFRLLAFICLSLGLVIAGSVLGALGYYKVAPHLIRIGDPFFLVVSPLIYLYTKVLCGLRQSKADLVHFIPFLIYLITLLPFYNLPGAEKIRIVDELFNSRTISPQLVIIAAIRLIIMCTYLVLSFQLIQPAENKWKNEHSAIDMAGINWWQQVLRFCFYLAGISVLLFILYYMRVMSFLEMNVWSGLVASCMLYLLAYNKWRGRLIPVTEEKVMPEEELLTVKYQTSVLSQPEIEKYGAILQAYLEKEKPFLDPDLTMNDLAEAVKLPSYLLSQVINRHFQQNFFDLVNGFRVKEVIRLMKDPQKQSYTLLAMAFEAGFNSKSAFNQVFKKHTGKTPSSYKDSWLSVA